MLVFINIPFARDYHRNQPSQPISGFTQLESKRTALPLHRNRQPYCPHRPLHRMGNISRAVAAGWLVADPEGRTFAAATVRHSAGQALHVSVGVDVRVVLFYRGRGARLVGPRAVGRPRAWRGDAVGNIFRCSNIFRQTHCPQLISGSYLAEPLNFAFTAAITIGITLSTIIPTTSRP